jgi:hypothetical protein
MAKHDEVVVFRVSSGVFTTVKKASKGKRVHVTCQSSEAEARSTAAQASVTIPDHGSPGILGVAPGRAYTMLDAGVQRSDQRAHGDTSMDPDAGGDQSREPADDDVGAYTSNNGLAAGRHAERQPHCGADDADHAEPDERHAAAADAVPGNAAAADEDADVTHGSPSTCTGKWNDDGHFQPNDLTTNDACAYDGRKLDNATSGSTTAAEVRHGAGGWQEGPQASQAAGLGQAERHQTHHCTGERRRFRAWASCSQRTQR